MRKGEFEALSRKIMGGGCPRNDHRMGSTAVASEQHISSLADETLAWEVLCGIAGSSSEVPLNFGSQHTSIDDIVSLFDQISNLSEANTEDLRRAGNVGASLLRRKNSCTKIHQLATETLEEILLCALYSSTCEEGVCTIMRASLVCQRWFTITRSPRLWTRISSRIPFPLVERLIQISNPLPLTVEINGAAPDDRWREPRFLRELVWPYYHRLGALEIWDVRGNSPFLRSLLGMKELPAGLESLRVCLDEQPARSAIVSRPRIHVMQLPDTNSLRRVVLDACELASWQAPPLANLLELNLSHLRHSVPTANDLRSLLLASPMLEILYLKHIYYSPSQAEATRGSPPISLPNLSLLSVVNLHPQYYGQILDGIELSACCSIIVEDMIGAEYSSSEMRTEEGCFPWDLLIPVLKTGIAINVNMVGSTFQIRSTDGVKKGKGNNRISIVLSRAEEDRLVARFGKLLSAKEIRSPVTMSVKAGDHPTMFFLRLGLYPNLVSVNILIDPLGTACPDHVDNSAFQVVDEFLKRLKNPLLSNGDVPRVKLDYVWGIGDWETETPRVWASIHNILRTQPRPAATTILALEILTPLVAKLDPGLLIEAEEMGVSIVVRRNI